MDVLVRGDLWLGLVNLIVRQQNERFVHAQRFAPHQARIAE